MHRNAYYKLLCYYCAYRLSYDSVCLGNCDNCVNADKNHICRCYKEKPKEEETCPYFRYLAR